MNDEMIVQAMFPLESFAAVRTHVIRCVGMLGSVEIEGRFCDEADVALLAEKCFLIVVTHQMASWCNDEN